MSRIKRFLRSMRHAQSGLGHASREQNFQIELGAAGVALALAVYLCIERWELAAIVLTILLVLALEIINTIFERVIDVCVPRSHPYAKQIKDMMAGAVLLACLGSVAEGFIIFLPHLLKS